LYNLIAVHQRPVKCTGQNTGLAFAEQTNPGNYAAWYQTYLGRSCAGRKCPHYGTAMPERDGVLVCPMHGLRADLQTLAIIDRELPR
jgi:hypothetical protein